MEQADYLRALKFQSARRARGPGSIYGVVTWIVRT